MSKTDKNQAPELFTSPPFVMSTEDVKINWNEMNENET